jgi:hypothetical protein
MVTRYGGEEFVIVMPQTMLEGACVFANRLRERAESKLPLTLSAGVAAAVDGDNAQTLLARADAALYGAKAAGRNQVFYHNGLQIQSYTPDFKVKRPVAICHESPDSKSDDAENQNHDSLASNREMSGAV